MVVRSQSLIKKQVGVRIIGPSRQIEEVWRWTFDFAPLNFHPERSDASLKKTRHFETSVDVASFPYLRQHHKLQNA